MQESLHQWKCSLLSLAVGCVTAGLLLLVMWPSAHKAAVGMNDFLAFYAGGKLAGTGSLYDAGAVADVQVRDAGMTGPALSFIRLPYFAVLLWPLARLPYPAAYLVWTGLSILAIVAFVLLWKLPAFPANTIFIAGFLPLMFSLMNGQDILFLLLWTALCVRAMDSNRPFIAGMMLSLCVAKFHLFAFVPLLIIRKRLWKFAAGGVAGGAVLVLVSFAVESPDWPRRYLAAISRPDIHPRPHLMPNIHGLVSRLELSFIFEVAAVICLGLLLWFVLKVVPWRVGLSLVIVAGFLAGHHGYLSDTVILLPALLMIFTGLSGFPVRFLTATLLTPVPYLLFLIGVWPVLLPLLIIALLLTVSVSALWHAKQQPEVLYGEMSAAASPGAGD